MENIMLTQEEKAIIQNQLQDLQINDEQLQKHSLPILEIDNGIIINFNDLQLEKQFQLIAEIDDGIIIDVNE